MKVTNANSDRLPQGCQIRAARQNDQWTIQNLLWGLIKSEGLNFEMRLFGYYLLQALLLVWLTRFLLQFQGRIAGIAASLLIMAITLLIAIALILIIFVVIGITFLIVGGVRNWSKYLVVECNRSLVACVAMRKFKTHTIVYNLFVKPSWRNQGIGSALVRQVWRSANLPPGKPTLKQANL
jgi:ribosomal protein S18 acetylase RimI-like enzyme